MSKNLRAGIKVIITFTFLCILFIQKSESASVVWSKWLQCVSSWQMVCGIKRRLALATKAHHWFCHFTLTDDDDEKIQWWWWLSCDESYPVMKFWDESDLVMKVMIVKKVMTGDVSHVAMFKEQTIYRSVSQKWNSTSIIVLQRHNLTQPTRSRTPDNISGTVLTDRNPIAGTYPNKEAEGLGRVGSLWGFTFAPLSPPSPLHRIALHSTAFNYIQLHGSSEN